MKKCKFVIDKKKKFKKTKFHLDKDLGFKFSPKQNTKGKNAIKTITILKKSIITAMLKKKVQIRLNYFFDIIASDDDNGQGYREALNDLSRYRDIVKFKYQKYFDERYMMLLLKKFELYEYELKEKIVLNSHSIDLYTKEDFHEDFDELEEINRRKR